MERVQVSGGLKNGRRKFDKNVHEQPTNRLIFALRRRSWTAKRVRLFARFPRNRQIVDFLCRQQGHFWSPVGGLKNRVLPRFLASKIDLSIFDV